MRGRACGGGFGQIIRSAIPVTACLLSVALGGAVPTGFEILSLLILATGVGLGCWEGSHQSSPRGVGICAASTLAAAAMLNFSNRVRVQFLFSFPL